MKTSFCSAAGLVVAAGFTSSTAQASGVTAQQQITLFNPEDFVFTLGGPEPDAPVDGFQIRAATLGQIPALDGQGIAMALVNLDACTINLPHIHPRATEMLYVINGEHLRVAFVEENGGEGAVVNDLSQGDVSFFPQGLIHYEQNLGCEPVTFLAALNNDDPGAVTITTRFFELPTEAIQASLNFEEPALQKLIESLPEAPAAARRQCLQRCGMAEPGKDSKDSKDSKDGKDSKDRKDSKDGKDSKDSYDSKDTYDSYDSYDSKDSKDTYDSYDSKDIYDSKDFSYDSKDLSYDYTYDSKDLSYDYTYDSKDLSYDYTYDSKDLSYDYTYDSEDFSYDYTYDSKDFSYDYTYDSKDLSYDYTYDSKDFSYDYTYDSYDSSDKY